MGIQHRRQRIYRVKQPVQLPLFLTVNAGIRIAVKIRFHLCGGCFHNLILPVKIQKAYCQYARCRQQGTKKQHQRKIPVKKSSGKLRQENRGPQHTGHGDEKIFYRSVYKYLHGSPQQMIFHL